MKKTMSFIAALALICTLWTTAFAGSWVVPGPGGNGASDGNYYPSGISVRLIDDLSTRSGPSTTYTECGTYRMKGQKVTVISRAFDNGGVQWAQVEITYGGAVRRMYTGVKRLDIGNSQLSRIPEEDMSYFIGYGTCNRTVNPKWGPGSYYATYTDRTLRSGAQVAVIRSENGYYQVEYYHTNGKVHRCWVPVENIDLN